MTVDYDFEAERAKQVAVTTIDMCPSTETATSNCTFEDYAALASRLDVLVIPPYECYA